LRAEGPKKSNKRNGRKEISPFANGDKGAALDLPPFEKGGRKLYYMVCANRSSNDLDRRSSNKNNA